MKVTCERCKLEGIRFEKGFKMSPIFEWLCDDCFDLLPKKIPKENFQEFKEKFLNMD